MQRLILAIGVLAFLAGVVLYVKSTRQVPQQAGNPKKNDLEDIDCNKHQGTNNTVIVTDDKTGIDYKHEAVFVCPGETVQWSAGTNVTQVSVDFNPLNWPFVEPYERLTASPGNPTKLKTVKNLDPGYRIQPNKYTITVTTSSGPLPALDPHVIPMGP